MFWGTNGLTYTIKKGISGGRDTLLHLLTTSNFSLIKQAENYLLSYIIL